MDRLLKFIALTVVAATSPAVAQSGQAPEWWLVLDERDSQAAHFVDLSSVTRSGQTVEVSAMILDRSGHRKAKVMNVDCGGMSGGEPAVTNFVCGSEEYRSENGLVLGMVSPDEMAQMLFAAQSGTSAVRSFQEA